MRIFTVVDFETTGLDCEKDQILEISAIKINSDGLTVGTLHTMVKLNPGRSSIPKEITDLTGIKTADLIYGIGEREAVEMLTHFIGDTIFVSHNAPFELGFMFNAYDECIRKFICTRALVKLIEPDKSASLKDVCERNGIPLFHHHRSANDVLAAARILMRYLPIADKMGIEYMNTVITSDARPIRYLPLYHKRVVKVEE